MSERDDESGTNEIDSTEHPVIFDPEGGVDVHETLATAPDPTDGAPAMEVDYPAESVEFDDRDVRVPRDEEDVWAEPPETGSPDPAIVAEAHVDSAQEMAPPESAKPSKEEPPSLAAQASNAFLQALEAHAQTLGGIAVIPQTSFVQFFEAETGHKVYVSKTAKLGTAIRVETTLPIVGHIAGASAPPKKNGKIEAVIDPDLEVCIRVLDLLAGKSFGKIRAPIRPTTKSP